jgi:hypothetical protein
LTHTLARQANAAYVPRAAFCEVVLNGSYMGVYTILEKVKRGVDRVNISKIRQTDISGDALTGGYIVKVDRRNAEGWYSPFRPEGGGRVYFNYVYPHADDIHPAQKAYIQAFVDSFENALAQPGFDNAETGWRRFADEHSFVEHFLFNELCKNVDAYRLSAYLYKPRDSEGGKLHAGPLWDFNLAWHNANYANNESPAGWTFQGEPYGVPFWWERLLEDERFIRQLQCRWYALRQQVLSQRHIFGVIDSLDTVLGTAKERHFELYPILGKGLWPNPKPFAQTHAEEIQNMKKWISERLRWMDTWLPGSCAERPYNWQPAAWTIFPNPSPEKVTVFFEAQPETGTALELTDAAGRLVWRQNDPGFENQIDMSSHPAGVYVLIYRDKSGKILNREKIIALR